MTITESPLARARRWLQAWDGQGPHRTGTAGDEAGAAWLAGEIERLGVVAANEEWPFDRLDPIACLLDIDGFRIEGVPVFDAPPTGADGIAGRLGPAGSAAAIGVVELPPQAVYSGEFEKLRREPGHRALVIVCRGVRPGLGLINAERFREPYGAPAIHVTSEARAAVLSATARGAEVRLVSASRRVRARARNIVATLPGRDRGRPPTVIMTPRSSWWQSTAERGGGIVCWLETLRALSAEPPVGPVVFTANSGHELGHLGLDDFSRAVPAGSFGPRRAARFGSITAPIWVLPAASCRSCRTTRRFPGWRRTNSRAPAGRPPASRRPILYRAARPATSIVPAGII